MTTTWIEDDGSFTCASCGERYTEDWDDVAGEPIEAPVGYYDDDVVICTNCTGEIGDQLMHDVATGEVTLRELGLLGATPEVARRRTQIASRLGLDLRRDAARQQER